MKDFIAYGDWWLPGKEDNKVHGTLEFSREKGGLLTLHGELSLGREQDYFNIVLGDTDKDHITLIDVHIFNRITTGAASSSLFQELKCRPARILKGCLFSKKEDIKFDKMRAKISLNAVRWVTYSMSVWKYTQWKGKKWKYIHFDTAFKRKTLDRIRQAILDDFKLSLSIEAMQNMARHKHSTEVYLYLSLQSARPCTIQAFIKAFFHCAAFFTLCIQHAIYFEEVIFRTKKVLRKINEKTYPMSIELYERVRIRKEKSSLHYSSIMIPFLYVKEHFHTIMEKWFVSHGKTGIKTIREVLYDFYARPGPYDVRMNFLQIIRAIEAFSNSKYFLKAEDLVLREKLVCVIKRADMDIQHLRESFDYWKNGVREEVVELIGVLCDDAEQYIKAKDEILKKQPELLKEHGSEKEVEKVIEKKLEDELEKTEWLKQVLRSRNAYVHGREEKKIMDVQNMYDTTYALNLILTIALFKHLGIPLPKEKPKPWAPV